MPGVSLFDTAILGVTIIYATVMRCIILLIIKKTNTDNYFTLPYLTPDKMYNNSPL